MSTCIYAAGCGEVNISGRNVRIIFQILGLEFGDGIGTIDPHELRQRIAGAPKCLADFTLPMTQAIGCIDHGVSEQYLHQRLVDLDEVAVCAIQQRQKTLYFA